jgi:uncharacterized membrane protein YgdD (TMEM256/DUF423 family)
MLDGLFDREKSLARRPALALLLGTLCFSGSLYAMALGAPRWLGMVTPVGGLALIIGFVWMAARAQGVGRLGDRKKQLPPEPRP